MNDMTAHAIATLRGSIGLVALMASLTLGACNALVNNPIAQTAEGDVGYWISANADARVSFGRVGEEANQNYGNGGFLAVANGPLGRKMSYVRFTIPTFPAGTEIREAKLELFHGGKNEDGTTDDIMINVGVVRAEPWSPATITWNSRPDRGGNPTADAAIRLRSQAWSGTQDISGIVRDMIASPSTNYGFVVWYQDPTGRQVEKGFYSNNDGRRTQTSLGLSPRIVMKVRFAPGTGTADVTLPFLPSDHDLGHLPQPITTVLYRAGSDWPTDWNVSP